MSGFYYAPIYIIVIIYYLLTIKWAANQIHWTTIC